jgi:hypothetical protein
MQTFDNITVQLPNLMLYYSFVEKIAQVEVPDSAYERRNEMDNRYEFPPTSSEKL